MGFQPVYNKLGQGYHRVCSDVSKRCRSAFARLSSKSPAHSEASSNVTTPPIDPHTKDLENQIMELKTSIKSAEAEHNKYQQENQTLKELLRVNGIPFIPPPATAERA